MKAFSQNGYTANDESRTKVYTIAGTSRKIRLHSGAPGALLARFFAWFDKHIEPIDVGQLDDWGFAVRPIRGQEVEYDKDGNAINLSNHASGTAGDMNATKHGLGQRGTFTKAKAAAIRAELRRPEYGGCIRWGGDYVNRADEMHFEIVRSEAACAAALKKLTTLEDDDMPLTPADLEGVYDKAYAANKQYGRDFWVAPTGTGTAALALLREIKIQLDRIEDDTDALQASKALVAKLDANMQTLAQDATS